MTQSRKQLPVYSFARVLPYVWPHRKRILLSFLFAGLVAMFWGLNLSVAFPVVKVLVQGQSLDSYVGKEIATAEAEIAKRTQILKTIDEAQERQATGELTSQETDQLLRDRSRQQSKLSAASRKVMAMNWVRNNILPWLPGDQFDLLAVIFACLLICMLLKGVCIFAQDVLIGNIVELSTMAIRKDCFRKTLTLDYQTLHLAGTADLMSRFTYDLNMLGYGLRLMGGKIIREPLKAACCLAGAFFVCWQLTLLSLLIVPLAGLVFYRIGRKLKLASRRMMESMSRIYKTLEETLDALKVVIAFNGGRKHRQRFHRESKEYYRKSQRIVSIDALTSPTTEVLGMLTASIALLPGAYLVLRNTTDIWGITLSSKPLDIAELSLMYVFLAGIIDPMRKLSTTYTKLKRGSAAAERIFTLLDKESLVTDPEEARPLPRHARAIEFRRIEFRYAHAEQDGIARPIVLNDVNLTVKAGEVVVVVGENGSGKSTLVNLIPRYYDPDHGDVLIDGVNISDVRQTELRSQIGVVTQETLLFDDTVYENIRYGKSDATIEEIESAAHRAHVTPFVEELPEGFHTRIGGKGSRLSGGQRQRIALARAILRNPSILILDEATSAIDAKSESLIHQSLREFAKGRTTFIITHSVSQKMLEFVTQIVVMDRGQLVATGTHGQLYASCPIYQRLFQAQMNQRAMHVDEAITETENAATNSLPAKTTSPTNQRIEESPSADSPPSPHIIPLKVARKQPADGIPKADGTNR